MIKAVLEKNVRLVLAQIYYCSLTLQQIWHFKYLHAPPSLNS